jgi:hypothetical protein
MRGQVFRYPIYLSMSKPKAASERRRPAGTIEVEQCLFAISGYMNVSRTMIIEVNDNEQPINSENGRHVMRIAYS